MITLCLYVFLVEKNLVNFTLIVFFKYLKFILPNDNNTIGKLEIKCTKTNIHEEIKDSDLLVY